MLSVDEIALCNEDFKDAQIQIPSNVYPAETSERQTHVLEKMFAAALFMAEEKTKS